MTRMPKRDSVTFLLRLTFWPNKWQRHIPYIVNFMSQKTYILRPVTALNPTLKTGLFSGKRIVTGPTVRCTPAQNEGQFSQVNFDGTKLEVSNAPWNDHVSTPKSFVHWDLPVSYCHHIRVGVPQRVVSHVTWLEWPEYIWQERFIPSRAQSTTIVPYCQQTITCTA